MALRFLLRPAVLASIALHGTLAAALWTTAPRPCPDAEARVCCLTADDVQGPEDAAEVPPEPEVPRLAPETLTEAPAAEPTDEPPPTTEDAELEPTSERAASVLPFLDRAPVGVRTASRPPAPSAASVPRPSGVVPLAAAPAPTGASPRAPQSASQRGTRATTDAVGEPTNRPPSYPVEALRRGWEGTAFVQVEVLEDGRVGRAFVETSSGFDVLDAAALDAVRGWRYQPRVVDGTAVRDLLRVPFRFRLRAA